MTRVKSLLPLAAVGCLLALVSCSSSPATTTAADGAGSTAAAPAAPPTPPAPPQPAPMAAVPPPPPPAAPVAEEARRISVEDAKKAVDAKRAVIVDVRASQQWSVEHIKGTLHIPESELMGRLKELPKDKMIITYCS